MGASSSTGNPSPEAHEQREQETLASAALSLPLLCAAFSHSAANALPDALAPPPASFRLPRSPPPPHFHNILGGLGPAIASQFFGHGGAAATEGSAVWVQFLRGFNRCCARVTASRSLAPLLRVYAAACAGAGAPCGVQLQSDEGGGDEDGKVVGKLVPEEIAVFLWVCWVMAWSASASRVAGDGGEKSQPIVDSWCSSRT